jgi:hypothetical protein
MDRVVVALARGTQTIEPIEHAMSQPHRSSRRCAASKNLSSALRHTRWTVGATEKTMSGRTWRYGFKLSIQDFRGIPLLSISYETEKEAKEAEPAIRKAIERAIDITKG